MREIARGRRVHPARWVAGQRRKLARGARGEDCCHADTDRLWLCIFVLDCFLVFHKAKHSVMVWVTVSTSKNIVGHVSVTVHVI